MLDCDTRFKTRITRLEQLFFIIFWHPPRLLEGIVSPGLLQGSHTVKIGREERLSLRMGPEQVCVLIQLYHHVFRRSQQHRFGLFRQPQVYKLLERRSVLKASWHSRLHRAVPTFQWVGCSAAALRSSNLRIFDLPRPLCWDIAPAIAWRKLAAALYPEAERAPTGAAFLRSLPAEWQSVSSCSSCRLPNRDLISPSTIRRRHQSCAPSRPSILQ